jgi:large subunit ribosomal protein L9
VIVQVILRQDYEPLGKIGTQVNVKDGYARNYLIPRGIAVPATKGNIRILEEEARLKELRENRSLKRSQSLAENLKKLSLTIPVKVGEEDKVFGAVTAQEISEQLKEKGYDIDKKQILLDEPIKALGIFDIPIKLHSEVEVTVKLWIIKA